MSRKREIYNLIDRDCINSLTAQAIKDYINNLHEILKLTEDKSARRKKQLTK